jgi:hypothetical protein
VIEVAVDTSNLEARLATMGNAVRASLIEATGALAERLLASVRLPDGPLLASIAVNASGDGDGARATLSSDLPYAAYQEYGFAGTEQVREHLRLQSVAFGRAMTPREVLVRAFARNVDYPGTAFLESVLAETSGEIVEAYSDAVLGAAQSTEGA